MKRDRDRDDAIDRMLGAGLRAPAGAADVCPQAGDLAAFVEGGLSRTERDTIERHTVACDRCQHALALIGSTQLPAAAAPGSSSTRSPVAWLRWAIPAASVAVVVLLYVAIRSTTILPPAGAPHPAAARALVAERPPGDRPSVEQERAGADRKVGASAPSAPSAGSGLEAGTTSAKRVARTDAPATTARDKVASKAPRSAAPAALSESVATPPIETRQNQVAPVSPGIAGNLPLFRQQTPAQQTPSQQATLQQVTPQAQAKAAPVDAPAAAPVVTDRVQPVAAAPGRTPAPAKATATALSGAESVRFEQLTLARAPVVIIVPGQSIRWRLEAGGAISRSRDGGLTWDLQSYRATSNLLAGSAPAANVCWLVGSAGTVLRTIDAERWEQRPFPERIDLIGVDARDGLHATITARDGRRFVTDDGGASWR